MFEEAIHVMTMSCCCATADEGGRAIGDMLTANHSLKKLLLSSNLLGNVNYGRNSICLYMSLRYTHSLIISLLHSYALW